METLRTGARAAARGLALGLLNPAGIAMILILFVVAKRSAGGPFLDQNLLHAVLIAVPLTCVVVLAATITPGLSRGIRRLARLTRRMVGAWCGVPIAEPYLDRTPRRKDPATWRDVLWLSAGSWLGVLVAMLPAVLIGVGVIGFIGSQLTGAIPPPAYPGNGTVSIVVYGAGFIAAGLYSAPKMLKAYGLLAKSMLAPTGSAALERRVEHLSQTRTETLDSGAAEIRRIERDLHDGAQARLVAMGMTLDAAGQLIDDDPKAARALLIEARDNSAKALRELRELVRGIHPPVLADRGLADAIRALALDTPLRIQLSSDLGARARPSAPIESAAYFAVNELVANVSKHAQASQAWIDIRHDGGMLKISVTDDGQGGADPNRGSGLTGIERRLAAFDGVLAVSSPPGGPTAVTMAIPCALS
ncbi:MAG TPA: histidine kinase [Streptosporangiaceae bacterium]